MSAPQPVTGRVALLLGGRSAEREISLRSGAAVQAALQRRGVQVQALDARDPVLGQLERGGYERAFVALHGRGGEDGSMQGALEVLGLPYTGSGVLASALAMDKLRSKRQWLAAGLPTPEFEILHASSEWGQVAAGLGLPLMVKPAREGSSIGMSRVTEAAGLAEAYALAAGYDDEVFAERYISGGEYTVGIVGDEVLPLIRLVPARDFYDYAAKYERDDTRYLCPCGLDAATERGLQELAWQAFTALGCGGWGRVDLMLDAAGRGWLVEVNTVPGMTDHSLVPMAAAAVGWDFDELVMRILTAPAQPGQPRYRSAGQHTA